MNQFLKETSGDKKIRIATSVTVVLLALSAGILSYDALRTLAVEAGIPPLLAVLFPITVDGLILSGSLLMLFFANKGKRSAYGFFLTALGVISSIAGNVAVSIDTIASQLVHATSPVVLFLSLEALTILLRWRSKMTQENEKIALEELRAEEALLKQSKEIASFQEKQQQTDLTEQTALKELSQEDNSQPHSRLQEVSHAPLTPLDADWDPTPHQSSSEPQATVLTQPEDASHTKHTILQDVNMSPSIDVLQKSPTDETFPPMQPIEKAVTKVTQPKSGKTLREQISDILDEKPHASLDHISDQVVGDRKYVRKLAREEINKRSLAA